MKNIQPHHRQLQPSSSIRMLDQDALKAVRGGEDAVAPRDPSTGLPTGKRT